MRAADAEVEAMNRRRAEPAMRAAAEQQGADLLPDVLQHLYLPLCETADLVAAVRPLDPSAGCLDWSQKENVYRLRVPGQKPRLVIPVYLSRRGDTPYERVARRGSRVVLLVPRTIRRNARSGHGCECSGGYIAWSTGDPMIDVYAFVIEDADPVELLRVEVPMVEDFIEWRCDVRPV
jgi:hypothetical protein